MRDTWIFNTSSGKREDYLHFISSEWKADQPHLNSRFSPYCSHQMIFIVNSNSNLASASNVGDIADIISDGGRAIFKTWWRTGWRTWKNNFILILNWPHDSVFRFLKSRWKIWSRFDPIWRITKTGAGVGLLYQSLAMDSSRLRWCQQKKSSFEI